MSQNGIVGVGRVVEPKFNGSLAVRWVREQPALLIGILPVRLIGEEQLIYWDTKMGVDKFWYD